jgi:hypothetical protein
MARLPVNDQSTCVYIRQETVATLTLTVKVIGHTRIYYSCNTQDCPWIADEFACNTDKWLWPSTSWHPYRKAPHVICVSSPYSTMSDIDIDLGGHRTYLVILPCNPQDSTCTTDAVKNDELHSPNCGPQYVDIFHTRIVISTPRTSVNFTNLLRSMSIFDIGRLILTFKVIPSGWTNCGSMRWFQYFKLDSNPFRNNRAIIFRSSYYCVFSWFFRKIVLNPH